MFVNFYAMWSVFTKSIIFQVILTLYIVIETRCSPLLLNTQKSNKNLSPSRKLINREFPSLLTHQEPTRIARAIIDPNVDAIIDDGEAGTTHDNDEILDSAPQTYYYYPYFRVRRISKRRYDDIPKHPLSNYADDYDRFPTVAWFRYC